jgi:hypothetical protein
LGENGFMKYEMKFEFGVTMSDGGKPWDVKNLLIMYASLGIINNHLGGKLKSMVNGAIYSLNEHPINEDGDYYGSTHIVSPSGVDFFTKGTQPLRQQNIFHETGHLLDNTSGTWNVFTAAVSRENNPSWVSENLINPSALNSTSITNDPNYGIVQARQTYNNPGPSEQWADAFANYVANNIDLTSPEGMDMNNFITSTLSPYIHP